MAVYFVRGPLGIKVGYSENVARRVAQLQTGSAARLKLLAVIPNGTREIEREFHELFARQQMEGEWFRKTDAIMRLILDIRQGAARLVVAGDIRRLLERYKLPSAERAKLRPPIVIPKHLRGLPIEMALHALDEATRDPALPKDLCGQCRRAVRRGLRGHPVDTGLLDLVQRARQLT